MQRRRTLSDTSWTAGEQAIGVRAYDVPGYGGDPWLANPLDTRISAMLETIRPVEPPPGLLSRIEASLDATDQVMRPHRWPRIRRRAGPAISGMLGSISGMAASIAFLVWAGSSVPHPAPSFSAHIVAEQGGAWVDATLLDASELALRYDGFAAPEGRSLEIWLVTGEGAAPVSMGLIGPGEGSRRLHMAPALRAAFGPGAALAVSEEPVGGASEGRPTGPILLHGTLRSPDG